MTETKKITDLTGFSKNPRRRKDPELKNLEKNLAKYGDCSGVVFNRQLGELATANQRTTIFKKDKKAVVEITERFETPTPDGTVALGYVVLSNGQKFAYRETEWDEKDHAAAAILGNTEAGQWDTDALLDFGFSTEELFELDLPETVFDFGWEENEEASGTPDNTKYTAEEDDFEVPEAETVKTDIVLGDLFELTGENGLTHRLLCGDSTDEDTIKRLMDGQLADLFITDPPYGVSYVGKTKAALTIQNDALPEQDTHKLWGGAFQVALSNMKTGAGIYATVPAGLLQLGFMQVMHEAKALRQCMVWDKGQMVLGHSDYHYAHEPILYGWKPGASHYFTSDRTKTTVFRFPKPLRNADHPTMKPVALWAEMITNSTKPKDICYDSFAGSGTTMVSCHETDRNARCCELSPSYCQVIVNRMLKLDPALKITKNGQPHHPK